MKEEGKLVQEFTNLEKKIDELKNKISPLLEKPDDAPTEKLIAYLREMNSYGDRLLDIENKLDELYKKPEYISMQEKIQDLYNKIEKFKESENSKQETENELSKLRLKIKQDEFESFLNEQLKSGTLSPAQKDMILQLFNELEGVKQFGETDYIEIFENFIKTLPKQVEFAEIATKSKHKNEDKYPILFFNASEESIAIYNEAKELAEREKISFKDALLKLYK